jgi:transcriptional accessory protein Tex/SPT6
VVSIGQTVEATVVSVDVEKRRIGLSLVERARQARDAEEDVERRETEATLAKDAEQRSLGTLADLLAPSTRKPNR